MTLAAADVISHNGREIGRFKTIRFCKARMTSAQSRSRCHYWCEPTSSLSICKVVHLVIYKTLALIFPGQKVLRTIYMQKSKPRYAFLPNKIIEVWIDRFCVRYDWWRRLHQCPRCKYDNTKAFVRTSLSVVKHNSKISLARESCTTIHVSIGTIAF